MKPIGLTFKNENQNPFSTHQSGELMIIHLCLCCGKISCNRIAGDDNTYIITNLLNETHTIDEKTTLSLSRLDIILLTQDDEKDVLTTLYGQNYERCI
jgi:hypothetical protein